MAAEEELPDLEEYRREHPDEIDAAEEELPDLEEYRREHPDEIDAAEELPDLGEYRREYPDEIERLPGSSVKSLEDIVRPFKTAVFDNKPQVITYSPSEKSQEKYVKKTRPKPWDIAAGPSKKSKGIGETDEPELQDVADVLPEESQDIFHVMWRGAVKMFKLRQCYDALTLSIKSLEDMVRPIINALFKSSIEDDKKLEDIADTPPEEPLEECDEKRPKLWDIAAMPSKKSLEISHRKRHDAAQMFNARQYYDSLKLYTESLKHAPINDDGFGLVLNDRSRSLFHLGFYKECCLDLRLLRGTGKHYRDQAEEIELREKECKKRANLQIEPNGIIPEIPENERDPVIKCCNSAIRPSRTTGYMVATRDITVGEVLLVEKPFMSGPIVQESLICSHCLKICLNPTPCPTCSAVAYCTKTCEEEALKYYHPYEGILSHLLKKNYWKYSAQIRMVISLRNYNITIDEDLMFGQGSYEDAFNNVDWRAIDKIEDTYKTADDVALLVYTVLADYTDFLEKVEFNGAQETKRDILKGMLAKMMRMRYTRTLIKTTQKKTVENKVVYEAQIGSLFPVFSHFNNSCAPNAMTSFTNNTVVVRAIERISANELVTVHYEYLFTGKCYAERQKRLEERWNMPCTCIACAEKWVVLGRLENERGIQKASMLMSLKEQVSRTFNRADLENCLQTLMEIQENYTWPKPSLAYGLYLEVCKMLFNKLDLIETPPDLVQRNRMLLKISSQQKQS